MQGCGFTRVVALTRLIVVCAAVLAEARAAYPGYSIGAYFVQNEEEWTVRGTPVDAHFGSTSIRIGTYRLEHEGGALNAPEAPVSGYARYYTGSARTERVIAQSIRYRDLYPGIDLIFHFDGNTLKSDYVISPGANPDLIRIRYAGAKRVALDGPDLVIDDLREAAPVAWQENEGVRSSVDAAYRLAGGVVTFDLGVRDSAQTLVIDPYVIAWSTVTGGTQIDNASAIAVDSSGYVYIAGFTESPGMFGSPLRTHSGGADAFVAKINPSLNQIVWATYLGGNAHDEATSIAIHPAGGVVVTGLTSSAGFPTHLGYLNSFQGGIYDAFVLRLDQNGALLFSTFFGGSGSDKAFGTAVTNSGNIWVVGETNSAGFPLLSPISGAARGGIEAFAARFNASGALLSSTTFGGSATDRATAVAVDSSGEAYITGTTEATNFPTLSPFQASSGGAPDAFVAKIAASGGSFRYSSYLGGAPRDVSFPETGTAIAVDSTGSAWVTGIQSSLSFPVVSPLQSTYGGGNTDGFLARISPAGGLAYSTYLGGDGSDEPAGIAILTDGSIAVGGSTTSTDLPLVNNVSTPSANSWDAFVVRVNSSGSARLLSTYMGGSDSDSITAVASSNGSIWVSGNSASPAFLPSGIPRGLIDAYVAEIRESSTFVAVTISPPGGRYWESAGSGCEAGLYSGPRTMSWAAGASCTVTMYAEPGATTRSVMHSWSDGSTSNPRTFIAAAGAWSTTYRTEHLVQTTATAGGSASPIAAWQAAGSQVQLTATPASGYVFSGWSGGLTGNPATVTVSAPVSVTASFACAFTLGTTSVTTGSAATTADVPVTTGSGCSWTATSNAAWVSVTTTAGNARLALSTNSQTGPRTGTVTVAGQTVTVTQSGTGTASIAFEFPAGRTWTVTGTGCQAGSYTGAQTLTWTAGASCAVMASSPVASTERHTFLRWSDGAPTNPRVFSASAGTWGTVYQSEYLVQTSAGTGGTATPASVWVSAGSTTQITANSDAGYIFSGWSAGASGNPAVVSVNGPLSFAASFACSYVLGSASANVSDTGATIPVAVTTGSGCTWSASSNAAWISVTKSASQAQITVAANTSSTPRTGTVTIAGQTFSVAQSERQSVSVAFAPPAGISWSVAGTGCQAGSYTGSMALSWTIGSQCTVTMQSAVGSDSRRIFAQWSDGSGANPRVFSATGAGSWAAAYVTEYLVRTFAQANGSTSPESAWVAAGSTVQLNATPSAGYDFTGWSGGISGNPATLTVTGPVTTVGSFGCAVALSRTGIAVGSFGSSQRIGTSSSCSWTPQTSAGWITASLSGTDLNISVAENTGAARSGTVATGARTLTITQAAVCRVTAKTTLPSPPAKGRSITIPFTVSPAGCAWDASSTTEWAQVFPLSGSGDGSVSVNVFAHFGLTGRSATVAIGNSTFTFAQPGATGTANERFAGLMYYNFLGRIASEKEIAFHAGTLTSGLTRKDFAYNFYNAEEFNVAGRFIAGLYVGLLNRDAEFGGWLFQRGAFVSSFVNQPSLVSNFLSSSEYAGKFGSPTNAEFVRLLYRYILGREATQGEVDFQSGQVGRISRVQLAMNLLNSNEFRQGKGPRLTAFLLYSCILLRDGTPAERDALATKVAAGTDIRALIDSLLTSPDFQKLLN